MQPQKVRVTYIPRTVRSAGRDLDANRSTAADFDRISAQNGASGLRKHDPASAQRLLGWQTAAEKQTRI